MKQIAKTPEIVARLQRAVGRDVVPDNLFVYEAIALNNRPLRKQHPLYKGAVAQRDLLLDMAARLERESVPLQVMHEGGDLPSGRAFYGEVLERGTETELRVLFFLDASETTNIAKIDAGSVDQVSVGILPKAMLCSSCDFDYFGPEASFDNIWTGTCNNEHTLGQSGVHAKMQGLDQWFELSLVGTGGAQNARIVSRDQSALSANQQRLAASGVPTSHLVLTATIETEANKMDLTTLVAQLTEKGIELHTLNTQVATLSATVTERDAEIVRLNGLVAEAGEATTALVAKDETIATQTADLDVALTGLKDVAKRVLIASGNQAPEVPETAAELVAVINEKSAALLAALSGGGRSQDQTQDANTIEPVRLGAYRTAR